MNDDILLLIQDSLDRFYQCCKVSSGTGPEIAYFARFGRVQIYPSLSHPARHHRLVISFSVLRVSLAPRSSLLICYYPLIIATRPVTHGTIRLLLTVVVALVSSNTLRTSLTDLWSRLRVNLEPVLLFSSIATSL